MVRKQDASWGGNQPEQYEAKLMLRKALSKPYIVLGCLQSYLQMVLNKLMITKAES